MYFDKSKVYTSVNADELEPGDKVIVDDNLSSLIKKVVEPKEDSIRELWEIKPTFYDCRFQITTGEIHILAYLVERKENCTNCGEGKWDAEHKKILCDPVHCGNGNVVFRNHEIEVCEYWKPQNKQKAEKNTDCNHCEEARKSCKVCELSLQEADDLICTKDGRKIFQPTSCCGDFREQKAEKHADYNHCEEARKAYACAMTNACPNKHYRPFRGTDELIAKWWELDGWSKREARYKTEKLRMPLIWVRYKANEKSKGSLITGYDSDAVYLEHGTVHSLGVLFDDYEFLDGSPCGVEE